MEKIKVLMIDDDADFLELMEKRIEGWGYDVIKASSGKKALEAMTGQHPDIAILDYMLPDMDGISVLKELRKRGDNIPVIMFTAYPDSKAINGAEKLGISAFIPKLSVYADTLAALKTALKMSERSLDKGV